MTAYATFPELIGQDDLHPADEAYRFVATIGTGGVDDILRGHFLDTLRAGLAERDYQMYAEGGGRVRFSFRTAADRDALYAARADEDFDYKVRKAMEQAIAPSWVR